MAGYDIITGEHLSKREKESRFIWGIIETALSIFLAVAAATGLLGKIGSKLSQKISPLIEKLEPYITKIDDAVGHVQKQICQAVQRAGGVVDDTFRLELIAGETIETLGKDVIQESGEAAGRRVLHEESGTVEEIQAVVTEGGEAGIEGGIKAIDKAIPNVENATINPKKLTEYALNPNHPVGGNKAKVFESALGYNQSNADDLMRQIYEKLPNSEAVLGQLDEYGQRYIVDIPITGPNGNTVNVRTGWIIKTGSDIPELTTLFIKD